MTREGALWPCPICGRAFANRGQKHACARHSLETHFAGKKPAVREIYDRFLEMLERFGPVIVIPQKSRIAFQVRMSFAQLTVRRSWVTGHLVLARRAEDSLFRQVESLSDRNHVHHFRIDDSPQVERMKEHAREAYNVGCQKHLG